MPLLAFTKGDSGPDYNVYQWSGATNSGSPDTFTAVKLDRTPWTITLQATGTFGASAAVALHGSVDGVNFTPLGDLDGTAISLAAAGLVSGRDAVLFLKPILAAGDGSTALSVSLLMRYITK